MPSTKAKTLAYTKNLANFKIVIGVSRYILTKCIERLDLHESLKAVMVNGADLNVFNPKNRDRVMCKEKYGIEENDLVVIFSGYFAWKKGLHMLLDAIDKTEEDLKLIIAGGSFYSKKKKNDKKYDEKIKRRISSMPNVIHAGALDQRELSVLLASSDLCVVPSLWEDPCPLVVAEATASGLPVVGTKKGGIPDAIVDGKTGFAVDVDPQLIADKISRLIEDSRLRRRMSLNSRKFAEEMLDWDVITRRIERAYDKVD
jgi:glycosyltransferase involved in cell wall biosynthesis